MKTKYYAYILKSLKDKRYYYGHTYDLDIRLKEHNNGKVRATKGQRPFIIHYYEEFTNNSEACKRELYFKSIDGYNWLKANNIILFYKGSSEGTLTEKPPKESNGPPSPLQAALAAFFYSV